MPYRKQTLILFILAAVLIFGACSNQTETVAATVPPKEIIDKAVAKFESDEIPQSLYFYKSAVNGENIIDIETAGLYFYDEYGADMTALISLQDYAIFMPNTFRVFEIDILLAEDESGLADAVVLLEARLTQKNNGDIPRYTPDEVPILEAAEIYTVGNYAILTATPDNAKVKAVIASMLKDSGASVSDIYSDTAAEASGTAVETSSETVSEVTEETSATMSETETETAAPVEIETEAAETTVETSEPQLMSESPVITVNSYASNNMMIFGGTCATDAEIIIRQGDREYIYHPDDDNFIGTVEWSASEKNAEISITAKQPDKTESEAQVFNVKTMRSITYEQDLGAYYYICGDEYQFFIKGEIPDYEGTNKFSDKQMQSIKSKLQNNVDYCSSIGAEVIYLVIPVPMNVYPELVSSKYTKNTSSVSRTSQFEDAAKEAGATVIDLSETFAQHKNDEFKLFHKTDTHWTQYGGYLGYREVIDHIAKSWDDVKVREIGEDGVEFYEKRVNAGDMPIHMGIQMNLLKENATFMNYNFDAPDVFDMYYHGTTRLDHSLLQDRRTITNPDASRTLPRAYIMRDSFGSTLYSLFNDAFSETSWQAMWNYDFKESSIEAFDPDYVIYIIAERNLDSVIG